MSDVDQANLKMVQPGDVLAEKYRVDRVLGMGGMGVVVAARHLQLDENVAIKFLLPEALGNQEAVGRFAREARAAVRIKNEHVARVIDVGTLPNGSPYMVMEYLLGSDVGQILTEKGKIPYPDAIDIVLQASEAIAEAHSLGIVHRDLKPANLFVVKRADNTECVKVLDFGISKFNGSSSGSDMSLTKTTAVMGSPLYMSPEQMASARNADARSDVWSLGIMLYELIAGDVPFNGESLPELCVAIISAAPPSLVKKCPDVPPGLEAAIFHSLEKEPAKRFAHIADFAVALSEFAPKRSRSSVERITGIIQSAGMSTSSIGIPAMDSVAPPRGGATLASWGRTEPGGAAGRRNTLILAATGGTLAVALLGVFLATRKPAPAASVDSAPHVAAAVPATPPVPVAAPQPAVVPAAAAPAAVVAPAPVAASAPAAEPAAVHPGEPVVAHAAASHAHAAASHAHSAPAEAKPMTTKKPPAPTAADAFDDCK